MDLTTILLLILATAPAWIFGKKFKQAENEGPLVMWRTKKGLEFLDNMAKHKDFWKAFADLGIIFCFGIFGAYYIYKEKRANIPLLAAAYAIFAISAYIIYYVVTLNMAGIDLLISLLLGGFGTFITYSLIQNTSHILLGYIMHTTTKPGVAPVIPGVHVPGSPIFVPLVPGIIALMILMVVHELSHGIVARAEKLKVKSLGILTLGIFPIGAFTEPDEEELKKTSMRKRLRVYAAGSMANFTTMFVFMLLLSGMQAIYSTGMQSEYLNDVDYITVTGAVAGTNAEQLVGLQVYNANDVFTDKKPYGISILQTNKGPITVTRGAKGLIGISNYDVTLKKELSLGYTIKQGIMDTLLWTFMLNLLVGIVNFLPFFIFDGAKIFQDLTQFYTKENTTSRKISLTISIFILILFIINALPYFIKSV